MDPTLLKDLLSRLSRHAFASFVAELFDKGAEPFNSLPEAGEEIFFQPLLDSYGGSLHTVFLLHYSPLELFHQINPKSIDDPILVQRLGRIRDLYKGKVGYFGMVAPELRKADRLRSLAFITNLHDIERAVYERELIPEYERLARKFGLKVPTVVGSYDSFIELKPNDAEEAFRSFMAKNTEGLCISISADQHRVERFKSERNLTGVLRNTRNAYEPIFVAQQKQKESVLAEFESLIREDTLESELEKFIIAHYNDIFGGKYDRIETQLWLRFPEIDITGHDRRLDVFLRNSVINYWELFEIKRVIDLTSTYRDAPVISREVAYAVQQVKNYARTLAQDSVKRYFAKQGIEYYQPTLNIVVGRTPQIPHEQWRWLLSANEGDVRILTFDNLLAEMKLRLTDRCRFSE